MNKLELLGYLIQAMREDRSADEEDMGLTMFRILSEIHMNMIKHGYLMRSMFAHEGLDDPNFGVAKRYAKYQTITVPSSYLIFGLEFARWLKGEDARERLEFADLLQMMEKCLFVEVSYPKRGEKTYAYVRPIDGGVGHSVRIG